MAAIRKRQKAKVRERECLRCEKTFTSAGPQNRLCTQCSKATTAAIWGDLPRPSVRGVGYLSR